MRAIEAISLTPEPPLITTDIPSGHHCKKMLTYPSLSPIAGDLVNGLFLLFISLTLVVCVS